MKAVLPHGRRRVRAALLSGSLVLAGGIVGLGAADAGADYPLCTGERIFDIPGNVGVELYDVSGYDVRNYALPFELVAGRYTIETSSFDGYIGRKDVPADQQERSERWYAEFLDADGNVVGAFGSPTTDLPDDTDIAEVKDLFTVTLQGTATSVRLVLVKDFKSLNLVHVGCLGFTRQVDPTLPPVTTAPPTTTPPTTAPPTTAPPTTAPPTTAPPTTAPPATEPTVTTPPSLAPASSAAPAATITTAPRTTLPFTGTDTLPLVLIGTGMVLGGAGFIHAARRREA